MTEEKNAIANNILDRQALEALLFHYGEPLTQKEIADITGTPETAVAERINELRAHFMSDQETAYLLLEINNSVQLVTKPHLKWVNQILTESELQESLTPVALETLALISYLGPISRPMIDFIRGVNTSFTLRNLVMRGLVARLSAERGMYKYSVTSACLSHLGVTRLEELPDYAKYRETLARYELKEKAEAA